jgi:glycosidase
MYIRRWQVTIPPQPAGTMLRYHLAAHAAGTERWIFADNQAEAAEEATDFAVYIDNDPPPQWAADALVYHIFVDRFNPGAGSQWKNAARLDEFFGGTLKGITEKLDYIQALGFNAVWLSPFFKSTSHHGYNASGYYTVEPRFGTNEDLRELIDNAHQRGMRMILDFVANHWSKDHPTFQDAQNDPNSIYHDWYIWKHWPDNYESYFNVRELPRLNLKPGGARDEMLKIAQHWLKEGFDGYRLDFAYGPPHDFWSDFRRACRTVKPDVWIFGEVIHTVATQRSYQGRFDGNLDFHLANAVRKTFGNHAMRLNEFEAFLSGHENYFPPQSEFNRPLFLDNHDEERFLFLAGGDTSRLKLAALIMYTLEGPPIVYNGTEVGVTQERPMTQGTRNIFEEARMPMKWGGQHNKDLLEYFQLLGKLRNAHKVLRVGRRTLLHVDPDHGTYAYARQSDSEYAVIAVNMSSNPKTLTLPSSGITAAAKDQLNGSQVKVEGEAVTVILPPNSGALII